MNCRSTFEDCCAIVEDESLTVGSSKMERKWEITRPLPTVISIKEKASGKEMGGVRGQFRAAPGWKGNKNIAGACAGGGQT